MSELIAAKRKSTKQGVHKSKAIVKTGDTYTKVKTKRKGGKVVSKKTKTISAARAKRVAARLKAKNKRKSTRASKRANASKSAYKSDVKKTAKRMTHSK